VTARVVDTRKPWWLIPLVLGALLLSGYVLTQVTGVLLGLVNPPEPPRPANLEEIAHQSEIYGIDAWAYITTVAPSELLTFYAAEGASCVYPPFDSPTADALRQQFPEAGDMQAACQGEQAFSRFVMRWRVLLSDYDSAQALTRLDVVRQVDWFGNDSASD
jgi:hypothetical protein